MNISIYKSLLTLYNEIVGPLKPMEVTADNNDQRYRVKRKQLILYQSSATAPMRIPKGPFVKRLTHAIQQTFFIHCLALLPVQPV